MVFPGGGPLPRHPSQLYEALLEGLLLFVVLYLLHRRKVVEGLPFFVFFIGYGLLRFLIEFVRQPDAHLGFLWGGATMGQLLSLPMMLFGVIGCCYLYRQRFAK
jgi:phosphatidylglycerol:prolipoprotein diacylglycerol transferase